MSNQIQCKCFVDSFKVSEIYHTSDRLAMPFFQVHATCVKCKEVQLIAFHSMPRGGSIELFKEHHEIVKEFYLGLE